MKHVPASECIGKTGFGVFLLSTWVALCTTFPGFAQVSYGGSPLGIQAEKHATIGALVDYVTELPPVNIDSLLEIDALPGNRVGGIKFAHTFFSNLTPENSGVTFTTSEGVKIWKVGVRSQGAYSLNVLFSTFNLPDGAAVFVYNKDQSCVLGAFTNKNKPDGGEFSVAPIEGDELIVEYQEPVNAVFSGKIAITEINHDYLGLFRTGTRFNQLNLPCLPDASCDTTYEEIARSTCLLIINGNTYCTGTLLNNTAQDGKPYLLTASHCLQNNPSLGGRVVAFLNYQSPRCRTDIRGSEEFSVSGSKIRALSNEVDFALLEFDQLPPADFRPYLAGWSTGTTSTHAPFTSLHHPNGEVLKYAVDTNALIPTNWVGSNDGIDDNNHWLINKWETGHTWKGSSGAPLFDNQNRVVGAMTGGDSGGMNGCETMYTGDFFFRFNRAWDQFPDSTKQLKHWLAPTLAENDRNAISLGGLDPYAANPAKRLSTILPTDSLGTIMVLSPKNGALFGQNSFGINVFAEHFTTDSASALQGLYLMVNKGRYNQESPVVISVYEGGSKPGKLLTKATLNLTYKDYVSGRFIRITKTNFAEAENYLRFNKPIRVGTDFYVGYEVDNTIRNPSDSFYVYAAVKRKAEINTSWFASGLNWYPFSEHPYQPVNTSLWLEPIVVKDTVTVDPGGEDDDELVEQGVPTLYNSRNSAKSAILFPEDWKAETHVEVYDMTGKRVHSQKGMPPILSLDFIPFKRHLYLIRVTAPQRFGILRLLIP